MDWIGQRNLIDAATRRGGIHVVLCSSMGGMNPDHPLNNLGKVTNADGTKSGGDILKWKRRAEVHLVGSGCAYTIVHPGGLLNEPGNERELCLGVDDMVPGTNNSRPLSLIEGSNCILLSPPSFWPSDFVFFMGA